MDSFFPFIYDKPKSDKKENQISIELYNPTQKIQIEKNNDDSDRGIIIIEIL